MGRMVCGDHISFDCFSLNRRLFESGNLPPFSCKRSHLAISVALELMEPAGAALSRATKSISCILPGILECGQA